jgi:uncharacterized protein with PQ loop repeat
MTIDLIGWVATAVFMVSYFVKRTTTLRRIQGVAACLWVLYGVVIHALPIIVANVLVAVIAVGSSFRRPGNAAA